MKTNLLLLALLALIGVTLIASRLGTFSPKSSDKDTVRMVCSLSHPPYVYMHEGKITGIDVELGEMIAKEAGRKLQISTVEFSQLIEMIGRKAADMALSALAITKSRRESVGFSDPYAFGGMILMVRSNENLHYLTDMEDRTGFRIGAEKGSTGYLIMEKYLKESKKRVDLFAYPKIEEAATALLNGEIDAVISDLLVARGMQVDYPGRMDILHDMVNHDALAVAISKDDPELLQAANRVIHRLWKSGDIYALEKKHVAQAFKESVRHD